MPKTLALVLAATLLLGALLGGIGSGLAQAWAGSPRPAPYSAVPATPSLTPHWRDALDRMEQDSLRKRAEEQRWTREQIERGKRCAAGYRSDCP